MGTDRLTSLSSLSVCYVGFKLVPFSSNSDLTEAALTHTYSLPLSLSLSLSHTHTHQNPSNTHPTKYMHLQSHTQPHTLTTITPCTHYTYLPKRVVGRVKYDQFCLRIELGFQFCWVQLPVTTGRNHTCLALKHPMRTQTLRARPRPNAGGNHTHLALKHPVQTHKTCKTQTNTQQWRKSCLSCSETPHADPDL